MQLRGEPQTRCMLDSTCMEAQNRPTDAIQVRTLVPTAVCRGGAPRGLGCPLICPDWGATGAHTLKLMTLHSADVCTEGPCAVVRSENAQTEQTCSGPVLPEGPSAAAISSGSGVGRRSSQLPTWGGAREGPAMVTSVLLESL